MGDVEKEGEKGAEPGAGRLPQGGRGCFAWLPGERQVFPCFSVWENAKGRVAREGPASGDGGGF